MKILLILFLLFMAFVSNAQGAYYAPEHYNLEEGLAIQGYDPVAYFTHNKAVEGKPEIKHTMNGVTYHFASEANKKLFVTDPRQYEPAYGGYCAYAMADGEKVRIDPETFKVKNGKLFLFYNFNFTNTLKKWNRDESNLYARAEDAWKKIVIEK